MADERLLRLLQECDQYLVRQRALLDRAAELGSPWCSAVAMEAAADQLATAVGSTWLLLIADLTESCGGGQGRPHDHELGTEPGE